MRRHSLTKLSVIGALLALACVSDRNWSPTQPSQPTETPSTLFSPSTLSCDPLRIARLLTALYPTGRAFTSTQTFLLIESAVLSGSIKTARALVFTFVKGLLADWKAGNLLNPSSKLGISQAQAIAELVGRLYTCVRLVAPTNLSAALDPTGSGGAGVVVPSSTETQVVVTGDGKAAVSFPPGSVPQTVVVTIVPTVNQTNPLPTPLDQYPPFYDFQTAPLITFLQPVTVGICVAPVDAAVFPRLQLAHPDPATGGATIEILHKVAAPAAVVCGSTGSLAPERRDLANTGFATRLLSSALALLRPAEAHAAALALLGGGLGGQTTSFSPFGAVDPNSRLNFIVQPSSTQAGATITPPVQVAVQDTNGVTIKSYQGSVTLAITTETGTAGAVLSGTTTRTVANGVATFADLSIDRAGTGYTLTPTATSQVTGGVADPTPASGTRTSTAFDVTPAPAADLVISAPATLTVTPPSVAAGGTVTLSAWTVTNQGTASSNFISNGFYLSTDATITAADVRLDGNFNTALAAGASFAWGAPTLTIPAGTAPGSYFIGILVDELNGTAESNEGNNFKSTAAFNITGTGTGTATIDGIMAPGEWDNARQVPFTANVPGEGTTPGTLFVMNDGRNLYLAVKFQRSGVDPGTNLLTFEFDDNNSGTVDNDDDLFGFSVTPVNVFSDAYRACGGSCVTNDAVEGAGAFQKDETNSIYELRQPLNSGDPHDFALSAGQTIGMFLELQIGSVLTDFPGFGSYLLITISP